MRLLMAEIQIKRIRKKKNFSLLSFPSTGSYIITSNTHRTYTSSWCPWELLSSSDGGVSCTRTPSGDRLLRQADWEVYPAMSLPHGQIFYVILKKARVFNGIDAAGQGPILSTNQRGLPTQGRHRDVSKRVQSNNNEAYKKIRIASLNIRTLTGKPEELAEMLRRKWVDICTLQEIRWSRAKVYNME